MMWIIGILVFLFVPVIWFGYALLGILWLCAAALAVERGTKFMLWYHASPITQTVWSLLFPILIILIILKIATRDLSDVSENAEN